MATTATQKKDDLTEIGALEKKIPYVLPQSVTLNNDGFCWREWMVRMSESAIVDDLKTPQIWKKLQTDSAKALRKFDRVFIVGFDESWGAEAIVSQATGTSVTLTAIKLIKFTERDKPLFSDGKFRVAWVGTGYTVERISDGQRMSHVVQTVGEAEKDLFRQYPKPAA